MENRNTTGAPRVAVLLPQKEAVRRFLGWMRDHGFDGWFVSSDIVEFYDWFCAECGIEPMNPDAMRQLFAAEPGVRAERRRIAGPEWEAMRIYLARCASRRKSPVPQRPELYRIASHEEMEITAETTAKVRARARERMPERRGAAMELSRAA